MTRWKLIGLWLLSSAFVICFSGRLKKIQVDEGALYVSNYFSEVRIALTDVETISQSYRTKPKTITIHFRRRGTHRIVRQSSNCRLIVAVRLTTERTENTEKTASV